MVNRSFCSMIVWSEMQLEERDEQIADLLVMLQDNEQRHSKPRRTVFCGKKENKIWFSERQDIVANEEICAEAELERSVEEHDLLSWHRVLVQRW